MYDISNTHAYMSQNKNKHPKYGSKYTPQNNNNKTAINRVKAYGEVNKKKKLLNQGLPKNY